MKEELDKLDRALLLAGSKTRLGEAEGKMDKAHLDPEQLQAFYEGSGKIGKEERIRIRSHIIACRECREMASEISDLAELREVREEDVGKWDQEKIWKRISSDINQGGGRRRPLVKAIVDALSGFFQFGKLAPVAIGFLLAVVVLEFVPFWLDYESKPVYRKLHDDIIVSPVGERREIPTTVRWREIQGVKEVRIRIYPEDEPSRVLLQGRSREMSLDIPWEVARLIKRGESYVVEISFDIPEGEGQKYASQKTFRVHP